MCLLSLSQLSKLRALNHSPMSDASVNFDYKSPSPFDCSPDQGENIEEAANHCLPQKDFYTTEEEADTLFSRKLMSHNGMEDNGGRGTGVKKKRKKKEPGEQEGTKGSKDREPKPKRKREPKEPKEPRRAKEPKEAKQKDGVKKPRKPREASGTKEGKEKRSCTDYGSRTKSKKARCVLCSLPFLSFTALLSSPVSPTPRPDLTVLLLAQAVCCISITSAINGRWCALISNCFLILISKVRLQKTLCF